MSIMQKINEDLMSVIEYMSATAQQVRMETPEGVFVLTLTAEPKGGEE